MNRRWIVVANAAVAKVYTDDAEERQRLKLVSELYHSEGLKRNQDLVSDRPGHYQTCHKARGSYNDQNIKEVENTKFVKKIITMLEKARISNQFQSLTLIAAPHFIGMLEKQLSKTLKHLIDKKIQKNLVNTTKQELAEIIASEH